METLISQIRPRSGPKIVADVLRKLEPRLCDYRYWVVKVRTLSSVQQARGGDWQLSEQLDTFLSARKQLPSRCGLGRGKYATWDDMIAACKAIPEWARRRSHGPVLQPQLRNLALRGLRRSGHKIRYWILAKGLIQRVWQGCTKLAEKNDCRIQQNARLPVPERLACLSDALYISICSTFLSGSILAKRFNSWLLYCGSCRIGWAFVREVNPVVLDLPFVYEVSALFSGATFRLNLARSCCWFRSAI